MNAFKPEAEYRTARIRTKKVVLGRRKRGLSAKQPVLDGNRLLSYEEMLGGIGPRPKFV